MDIRLAIYMAKEIYDACLTHEKKDFNAEDYAKVRHVVKKLLKEELFKQISLSPDNTELEKKLNSKAEVFAKRVKILLSRGFFLCNLENKDVKEALAVLLKGEACYYSDDVRKICGPAFRAIECIELQFQNFPVRMGNDNLYVAHLLQSSLLPKDNIL